MTVKVIWALLLNTDHNISLEKYSVAQREDGLKKEQQQIKETLTNLEIGSRKQEPLTSVAKIPFDLKGLILHSVPVKENCTSILEVLPVTNYPHYKRSSLHHETVA